MPVPTGARIEILPSGEIGLVREDDGEFHTLAGIEIQQLGAAVHGDHVWRYSVTRDDRGSFQLSFERIRLAAFALGQIAEGNHVSESGVVGGSDDDVAFFH
jgi:hypothetical protein